MVGFYSGAQFKSDSCQSEKGKVGVCRVDGGGFSDRSYQTATLHSSGQVSDTEKAEEQSW